jgi:decaprenylphospho-beta-D-erythro-pentofuranosid-2-ulose 2-reductase
VRRIAVFGATSAIAQGFLRAAAAQGDALFVVGRNAEKLSAVADDIRVRGARLVHATAANLEETWRHAGLIDEAERTLGGLDAVLVAHGTLPNQAAAERDFTIIEREIRTNFLSAASILTVAANRFEEKRAGVLVAISSVAGDRGRRSNYVYGAAKAALSAFLSGLRGRLAPAGVSVVTVKPGFVDTPMTAHLPKNALFATSDAVGRRIYRALERREDVVYIPFFWALIMRAIRLVPERIFKRLTF